VDYPEAVYLCEAGEVQNEQHIVLRCSHFNDQRSLLLDSFIHHGEGTASIWDLFNDPHAQSAIADFLLTTGLMVN
jgi:hypothetical protein